MKLWGGRFTKETNELVNNFNASISFDQKFYKQDIQGSIAHATMLAAQGIISEDEGKQITDGLKGILSDIESGKLEITDEYEDIHTFMEATLIERIGDAGKKLHGKRNHINKFKQLYPDWSYESLSDENVEECFQMALKWRNSNGCNDDPEKNAEMCVSLNSLRLYKELGFKGGVLRNGEKIVAFTVGEELCKDTFVVHIEKAFADVQGAYPMINQQFVEHECMDYTYVNREDDAGEEGLRKAKLSYRPAFLEEKGFVTRIGGQQ
jgi:hypothetical protein